MARRNETKRSLIERWIAERKPERIGEAEHAALLDAAAPISADYLRRLLRGCGLPLDALVEGVNTATLDDLERTLNGLSAKYAGGDRRRARDAAIKAKNHVRWTLRRSPDPLREEMLLWILTWLENPEAFPIWAAIRARRIRP